MSDDALSYRSGKLHRKPTTATATYYRPEAIHGRRVTTHAEHPRARTTLISQPGAHFITVRFGV